MYNTPIGHRILDGYERYHFGEALGTFADYLLDTEGEVGVAGFDELQKGQKLTIVYTTARALLYPDQRMPKIRAAHEAAIAAIFEHSKQRIEIEIDLARDPFDEWENNSECRNIVSRTARECLSLDEYPEVDSDEQDEWDFLIQCLSERVIWDSDYQLTAMLDVSPELSKEIRTKMGVDDDYFSWVPQDLVNQDEIHLYIDAIRGIVPDGYIPLADNGDEGIPDSDGGIPDSDGGIPDSDGDVPF